MIIKTENAGVLSKKIQIVDFTYENNELIVSFYAYIESQKILVKDKVIELKDGCEL